MPRVLFLDEFFDVERFAFASVERTDALAELPLESDLLFGMRD
jgi:hypothetical protein